MRDDARKPNHRSLHLPTRNQAVCPSCRIGINCSARPNAGRIGRQAAKFYATDDVINRIAEQILVIDRAQREPNVISLVAERTRRR
jgi:hypothetical protein